MKVFTVIRTTLLVAAVLGACTSVDAKKIKLCDADGHATPAPTPAKTGAAPQTPVAKPAVTPAVTPAAVKPETAGDADVGKVVPAGPAATPAAPGAAPAAAPGAAPAAPASGPAATPAPAPSAAPAPAGGAATSAGNVKASFSYKGANAGGPGTYQMVTDFETCSKAPQSMYSPISPLDDDLTFVFRGPLTIHNIAIFDGTGGAWNRVSSYAKDGATENLVFFNNRNIDYSGKSGPQGFATGDGRGNAQTKQSFGGELAAASSPNGYSVYADEKTGAEVNIFQDKKCGDNGVVCKGYYDKDGTAYLGWGGAKKIFVTKVHMPHKTAPDMPAVWALNGQVVRASQYGCNCRGVGTRGGCGELDIAEVIPGNADMVATHYYKYESSTGHDTWSKRPADAPTTYITIIDEAHGVKVLEVDDFEFGAGSIATDVVDKWQSA